MSLTLSPLYGKSPTKKVECPFCGAKIEKPRELPVRKWGEMPVGSCTCGAVYACDVTGHNLGSAMVEALVFGCNMDWDLAWGLIPEEDYLEALVENYDYIDHVISVTGCVEGRKVNGALYFIRLHDDIQEVTSDGVRKILKKAEDIAKNSKKRSPKRKPLSKKEVEELVRNFRVDEILKVAKDDRKIVRNLMRLLYSVEDEYRMRAAEMLGIVTSVIAERNPGFVSKLLQNLFTAIIDSAASSWGAFEAIGEIISHKVEMFAGYIPHLYRFLPDEERRVSALQAIGKIAQVRPDLLNKLPLYLIPLLKDPDYRARGYAAWMLGYLGTEEIKEDLEGLFGDTRQIGIYRNGTLKMKTLDEIAREAIDRL